MLKWLRGTNTPSKAFPNPPVFAEPCARHARGAWRNLGGHWVREKDRFSEDFELPGRPKGLLTLDERLKLAHHVLRVASSGILPYDGKWTKEEKKRFGKYLKFYRKIRHRDRLESLCDQSQRCFIELVKMVIADEYPSPA